MKNLYYKSIKVSLILIPIIYILSSVSIYSQWDMRVVTFSGQPAPGTNEAVFSEGFIPFSSHIITNSGRVYFSSSLEENIGDGTGDDDRGIWLEKEGELSLFARSNKPIPNSDNLKIYLDAFSSIELFADQATDKLYLSGSFSHNGGEYKGGFLTNDEEDFLTLHTLDNINPYPGGADGPMTSFRVEGFNNGFLLIDGYLKDVDKIRFNNSFLAVYKPGISGEYELVPLVRGGDPMVGNESQIYRWGANSGQPVFFMGGPDKNGQSAIFCVGNDADYMNDNVEDDNVYTLYKSSFNGNLEVLKTTYQGEQKYPRAQTKFSEADKFAFLGYLDNYENTSDNSIWVGTGPDRVVASRGDHLDGVETNDSLQNFIEWTYTDDGRVAFYAALTGNKKGIWMEDDIKRLKNIVLTGKPLPGSKIVSGFDMFHYSYNSDGKIAFRVWGLDENNIDMQEVWAGDTEGLSLVVRTGNTIEVAPGDERTVQAITMPYHWATNTDSDKFRYSAAMNSNEEVLLDIEFTDGSYAVVVASGGLVVNSVDDDVDINPGDGICECEGPKIEGKPKCTLRAAIMEANAKEGKDKITFDIPGDEDTYFIQPQIALPTINDPVTITGSKNDQEKPNIYLNGDIKDFDGLTVSFDGEGSSIKNLIINHFRYGILIDGSWENTISSCFIGTDVDEGDIAGNEIGIVIKDGNANTIGGNSKEKGNYISANGGNGLVITGIGSKFNKVLYNTIGPVLDPDGVHGNGGNGVLIEKGSSKNTIRNNVISSNFGNGIHIIGTSSERTESNEVYNNNIGTNADNDVIFSNEKNGILIENSQGNKIGDMSESNNEWMGNNIAGNNENGIEIKGKLSAVNFVYSNKIGINLGDITSLPNEGNGILINNAPRNVIGLLTLEPGTDHGNYIEQNMGSGIRIEGEDAIENKIEGNLIRNNEFGIRIINAKKNTIGNEAPQSKNVIVANTKDGILIDGIEAKENRIENNYIGVDETGLSDDGNIENGIKFAGGSSFNTASGNVISGNFGNGVMIEGSQAAQTNSNNIYDNIIGLDNEGNSLIPNRENGIYVLNSDNNNISSEEAVSAPGNIISGNNKNGILIEGENSNSIRIMNSYIGTDIDGYSSIGNKENGIKIIGAVGVIIGDDDIPGSKGYNLISGNQKNGILIEENAKRISVNGNLIGTDVDGSNIIKNAENGIQIVECDSNIIGELPGYNIISGNGNNGISIIGDESNYNIVGSNLIGTDADGKNSLGNEVNGIELNSADNNTIGGIEGIKYNVISGNKESGILLSNGADNNNIIGNLIGTNKSGKGKIPTGNDYSIGVEIDKSFSNKIGFNDESIVGNLISGNNIGLKISNAGAEGKNIIKKNIIGLAIEGNEKLSNKVGIQILRSNSNYIGGSQKDDGNVISGNTSIGIEISESGTNEIRGNFIGTGSNGSELDCGNDIGIKIWKNSKSNIIGSLSYAYGNIISGNSTGILIFGVKSEYNEIFGNKIGTDKSGKYIVPNNKGIELSSTHHNFIGKEGADMNLITGNEYGISIRSSADYNQIIGNQIGSKETQSNIGNSIGIDVNGDFLGVGRNSWDTRSHVAVIPNRIENNGIGINMVGRFNSIHSYIKANEIFENSIGINIDCKGIDTLRSIQRIGIFNNEINKNRKGINLNSTPRSNVIIQGNTFFSNWSDSSSIHLDNNSNAIIEGNMITKDFGSGVFLNNGSNAQIQYNNIYDNSGKGVNNLDPSVLVNAHNNWWGDPTGPSGAGTGSGEEVSEYVDFTDWLSDVVSLFAGISQDTIFVYSGMNDSTIIAFRNWSISNDVIDIKYDDEFGWLYDEDKFTLELDDKFGSTSVLKFEVPGNIDPAFSNKVSVNAKSQNSDSEFEDSFILYSYEQKINSIHIIPDSITLPQGEMYIFNVKSIDQKGNEISSEPQWFATGGNIDDDGVFVAGFSPGIYNIIASDPISQLKDTAVVIVDDVVTSIDKEFKVDTIDELNVKIYPNPISGKGKIMVDGTNPGLIRFSIYDIYGNKVKDLPGKYLNAGLNTFEFNMKSESFGVYFVKISHANESATIKFIYMR